MAEYEIASSAEVICEVEKTPEVIAAKTNTTIDLQIGSGAIVMVIGAITVLLSSLSLLGTCIKFLTGHDSVFGFIPTFNLDTEGNIPTYFSALLLLLVAGLMQYIAIHKKSANDAFARQWAVLSYIFIYMSVDEAVEIHGMLMRPLNSLYVFGDFFHFSWVVVGIGLLAVAAIYFLRFYLALNLKYKRQFLAAAVVYISGLIGMELIGGAYAHSFGEANITYELITTLEETFEMAGIVLLIRTLLCYIKDYTSGTRLSVKN
ncbi:hypothetical protein WG947_09510 [Pontibacter sp. H259]|uniref:hypothetical protein n=1 Tax=Pontibacter sp. H259 TaxID=3133421 RepID=UPI0030C45971